MIEKPNGEYLSQQDEIDDIHYALDKTIDAVNTNTERLDKLEGTQPEEGHWECNVCGYQESDEGTAWDKTTVYKCRYMHPEPSMEWIPTQPEADTPDSMELLPCPFCGSDGSLESISCEDEPAEYFVVCTGNRGDCFLGDSMTFHSKEESITAWNRRAEGQDDAKDYEQLWLDAETAVRRLEADNAELEAENKEAIERLKHHQEACAEVDTLTEQIEQYEEVQRRVEVCRDKPYMELESGDFSWCLAPLSKEEKKHD